MDNRKEDSTPFDRFRPSRFFMEAGKWYYHTREGSTEGPFQHRLAAEKSLQTYINIGGRYLYLRPGGQARTHADAVALGRS
jgi:hypothetical protein